MAKKTVRLDVPARELAWLDRQVSEGAFPSRGEAFARLLRRARVESSQAWIETEIEKGLASGSAEPLTPAARRDILKSAKRIVQTRKASGRSKSA
ncbi:MAG: hypothetical protein HEQ23_14335 [Tepidisphaera sp.]